MSKVARFHVHYFPVSGGLIFIGSILLAFAIVTPFYKEKTFFPLSSYSITENPELAIFRIGILCSVPLILLTMFLVFQFFTVKIFGGVKMIDKLALGFGVCSSFFLVGFGGTTLADDFFVHTVCAVLFHLSNQLYMLSITGRYWTTEVIRKSTDKRVARSRNLKFALTTLSLCAFIIFVSMAYNLAKYYRAAGALEWFLMLCYGTFVTSFASEFSQVYFAELQMIPLEQQSIELQSVPSGDNYSWSESVSFETYVQEPVSDQPEPSRRTARRSPLIEKPVVSPDPSKPSLSPKLGSTPKLPKLAATPQLSKLASDKDLRRTSLIGNGTPGLARRRSLVLSSASPRVISSPAPNFTVQPRAIVDLDLTPVPVLEPPPVTPKSFSRVSQRKNSVGQGES